MNVHDTKHWAQVILANDSDKSGQDLCLELARRKNLSKVVKILNKDVLDGAEPQRLQAITALTRLGLWVE